MSDNKNFKFNSESSIGWEDDRITMVPFHLKDKEEPDMVNNPSHYTSGRVEAIEVIEDAILNAPTNMDGFLQGQVLKHGDCGIRLMLKKMPKKHVGISID